MLEVTINGKLTKVPPCTCGKCIVRRLRKDFFSSFPYNKDLASTYKNDYDWKTNTPDNPDEGYNRSKHNGFEGAYKEHIPTSLISTMKMDYKPFKVQLTINQRQIENPLLSLLWEEPPIRQPIPTGVLWCLLQIVKKIKCQIFMFH